MNGFLLDTNCISEVVRLRPEPRVIAWFERADEAALHLSVMTLGEIRKGIHTAQTEHRRTQLETWLTVELPKRFGDRILPIDKETADRWGHLASESKRVGRLLPVIDALLAATALRHDLAIVTRNTRDFSGLGVNLIDPWEQIS